MTDGTREQLRRLKNTVMGASNRLSILARSGDAPPNASNAIVELAAELAACAQKLDRLLALIDAAG